MSKKKLKNLKIAIFISDVGFGHMVRQRSIIKRILQKYPNTCITLINHNNMQILKQTFKEEVNYINHYNNIKLKKSLNGFLDIKKTKKIFENWNENKTNINEIKKYLLDYDLFISDFVPEAFLLAKNMNIRSIGVCHFTWSWFAKSISKKKEGSYQKIQDCEKLADKIFFPPFTPKEILNSLSKIKIEKTNFITDKKNLKKTKKKNKKKIFLVMDSGTKTLSRIISKSLRDFSKNKEYIFYVGTSTLKKSDVNFILKHKNLIPLSDLNSNYDQIQKVDFVIARAGFNTLTECLMFKKPSLLFSEKNNPEIEENLKYLIDQNLCARLDQEDYGSKLINRLHSFEKLESKKIIKNINNKKFYFNGAEQILKYIESLF